MIQHIFPEESVPFNSIAFADAWLARRAKTARLLDELLYPKVKQLVGDMNGLVAADLGCGNGESTKILRGASKIFACDINDFLLKKAAINLESISTHFLTVDLANTLPFPNNFFDRIICCQVLMHLDDYSLLNLIRDLYRTLKQSGRAILTTGHPEWVLRRTTEQGNRTNLVNSRIVRYGEWEGTTVCYYFCYNDFLERMFRSVGFHVSTSQIDFPYEMCDLIPEYHDRAGWPLFTIFQIQP
jgi:SAM-dependent methyltransferase